MIPRVSNVGVPESGFRSATVPPVGKQVTVYEAAGGTPFFAGLVERFYARVAEDELLRPMYPNDLSGAKERLTLFLVQYWGGPTAYSDQRGHPRLRMRHNPFVVDTAARDAWLRAMLDALEEVPPPEPVRSTMIEYFVRSADFMRNTPDPEPTG